MSNDSVCKFCGMQTEGGTNHATDHECLNALVTETERLRRALNARAVTRTISLKRVEHDPARKRKSQPGRLQ